MCDRPPSILEFNGSFANCSILFEASLSSISRPIIVSLLVLWMTPMRDLIAATGRAALLVSLPSTWLSLEPDKCRRKS